MAPRKRASRTPALPQADHCDDSDESLLAREALDLQREKHPSDPEVEYVPAGFDAEDFLNHYPLDFYRERAATGDPTAIIEAFVRAHDDHCYPRWLMDHIARACHAYRSNKAVSLDDALRLSPAKWTQRALEARHWALAQDVYRLTAGLGLSLNTAVEMVLCKMRADPERRNGRTRSFDFSPESLKRKYTREWKAQFSVEAGPARPPCYHGGRDPDRSADELNKDWARFLHTFPPEAWDFLPAKLLRAFSLR